MTVLTRLDLISYSLAVFSLITCLLRHTNRVQIVDHTVPLTAVNQVLTNKILSIVENTNLYPICVRGPSLGLQCLYPESFGRKAFCPSRPTV